MIVVYVLTIILWCVLIFIYISIYGFLNDIDVVSSHLITSNEPIVFGIGLPRTGTCSLAAALNILGYKSQHFPINIGHNIERYLSKRNAIVDITMLDIDILKLHNCYKNALFIYTYRDVEDWVHSIQTLRKYLSWFTWIPKIHELVQHIDHMYGTTSETIKMYKEKYEETIVSNISPDRLLRLDIIQLTDEERWLSICSFLKKEIPEKNIPFPNQHHLSYQLRQTWGFA
jgi:hypothetical protein